MSKDFCAWAGLGVGALLALAALLGCQAAGGPQPSVPSAARPQASIQAAGGPYHSLLDECVNPTPSNRDWCLSMQIPNAE